MSHGMSYTFDCKQLIINNFTKYSPSITDNSLASNSGLFNAARLNNTLRTRSFKAMNALTKLLILLFTLLLSIISSPLSAQDNGVAIVEGYAYHHQSKVMAEQRRYQVALPERYFASNRQYPTLYVVDGDFQFQHVSATVHHLTRMGKIAPMIVVGIANQGPTDYLYATTWPDKSDEAFGGAVTFHRYITNELVPLIDKQYRTNNKRALSGYSLGGLFTLFSMTQADTPFNAFVAMSPSAWFDNQSITKKLDGAAEQQGLKHPLFISVANEQEMGVDTVVQWLEHHAPESLLWQFKSYPEENHFTTALPALYDALTFLSPDYGADGGEMLAMGDVEQVLSYFETSQSQWGGFEFEWLQAYQFAKYLFWSKQTDKIDQVLAQIAKKFPRSLTIVTVHIAKGMNIKGEHQRAKQLLDSVAAEGINSPDWQHELSVYYDAQQQTAKADHHQQLALSLAQQYQLRSWDVWELK